MHRLKMPKREIRVIIKPPALILLAQEVFVRRVFCRIICLLCGRITLCNLQQSVFSGRYLWKA